MTSEFKQFLDTLRRLGIDHVVNHGPTKKAWQRTIIRAGYNITALACTVVEVGSQQFLFCNGPIQWDRQDRGYGPSGLFMLCRDRRTHQILHRRHYDLNNGSSRPGTNLRAAQAQYPVQFGLASCQQKSPFKSAQRTFLFSRILSQIIQVTSSNNLASPKIDDFIIRKDLIMYEIDWAARNTGVFLDRAEDQKAVPNQICSDSVFTECNLSLFAMVSVPADINTWGSALNDLHFGLFYTYRVTIYDKDGNKVTFPAG